MKIGILSFQNTNNFGAYLHVIALYKKLKQMGCDVQVIDYMCSELNRREVPRLQLSFSLKAILSIFISGIILKKKYKCLRKELSSIVQLTRQYDENNIKSINSLFDRFMVGSDIVWALDVTGYDYNYFLNFVKDNNKKVAFSSSVGDCNKFKDDSKLSNLLRGFTQIAVRETEAQEWVRSISGKYADYVCDPTMLLTSKEWDECIKPKNYHSDYALVYFVDKDRKCLKDAIEYSRKHDLKVKFINYGLPVKDVEIVKPTSLSEFIGLIKHSKMLFTASYHGMLFGLYYHKELMYYNRAHKSRMSSLATILGVEDKCGDSLNVKDYLPINYVDVEKRINEFRGKSEEVLQKMVE